jgi:hypothetical protein
MNEALQQALLEILSGATAGITAAKNFLTAEIPEVAQQLLMWKLFDNLMVALFCTLFMGGVVFLALKAVSHARKASEADVLYRATSGKEEREAGAARDHHHLVVAVCAIPAGIGSLLALLIALPTFFDALRNALQIWLAPKLYLIEYAATLAQKVTQ